MAEPTFPAPIKPIFIVFAPQLPEKSKTFPIMIKKA
jgi:hypothetical protein